MWPHGGDSGANGISRMSIENPCCEFLRRIMIAGEEPCVLSSGVEKSSRAGAPRSRKPACLRGAIQVARDACRGTDHLRGADSPCALETGRDLASLPLCRHRDGG